jgi:AcrR family transcriptional regulator
MNIYSFIISIFDYMKKKDEEKYEAIYQATLTLAGQWGFAGITMAKIADEAGVATGTTYLYFKNKDELINEIYKRVREQFLKILTTDYLPETDFYTGFRSFWMSYIQYRLKNHRESVFLEQYHLSLSLSKDQRDDALRVRQPFYDFLLKGQHDGIIRSDVEYKMLFSIGIGFVHNLVEEHLTGRFDLTDENVEKAFLITWNMMAKEVN